MYLYEACNACIYVNKYNNKSNLTAGAVQVEANLQEELSFHLHFGKCCYKRKILKVISHLALSLTVSEILEFQSVYLEKVGQGH